jgi:hypothetical protein
MTTGLLAALALPLVLLLPSPRRRRSAALTCQARRAMSEPEPLRLTAGQPWRPQIEPPDHESRHAMRTRRFTRVSGMALAFLFILTIAPTSGHGDSLGSKGGRLDGVWQIQVTILSECGPTGVPVGGLPTIITFTRDGKVIETPGTLLLGPLPVLRVSPGLGAWQHLGRRHYTAVFRFFRINVPAITFAGTQKITEDIELSKDADEYAATGTSEVFDTDGNLTQTSCITLTGTRLEE